MLIFLLLTLFLSSFYHCLFQLSGINFFAEGSMLNPDLSVNWLRVNFVEDAEESLGRGELCYISHGQHLTK